MTVKGMFGAALRSAFFVTILASASGASAQEETQIRAERPLEANDALEFQAGPASVRVETSVIGASVTTTLPPGVMVDHAVDIVLSCTDGTAIFNELIYTPDGKEATQDCDPGAELFLAEVSIHLRE